MWQEFAEVLPRIWTEEVISYHGTLQIPPREVLPKPVQRPHPPLWSACGGETAAADGASGHGGTLRQRRGPERVQHLLALYHEALRTAPVHGAMPNRRTALMTAGYCHEDPQIVAQRGAELIGWYLEQRERARLVWRDYDPTTVPPDYQGYYARDQRLASGRIRESPPQEVRERGTSFFVGARGVHPVSRTV